ncbi:MAG: TolC family outer membrane protein [Candidatus Sedimenticola sp. (ex Thyasira tokunagai)]
MQVNSIFRTQMKKGAIALSISALLMSGALQAEPLGELLPNLLENHDKIKAAKADLESAGFSTRQANAAWYPSVTLTADYGTERQVKPAAANTDMTRSSADLKLTQLLADFGATSASTGMADSREKKSMIALERAKQDLLLDGVTTYMNLLRAIESLTYARQSEGNIKRQTGMEQSRVDRGSGFRTDVLQTKSALAGASATRVRAEGTLATSINRYRTVFRADIADLKTYKRPLFPAKALPKSTDEAIELALSKSLTLRSSDIDLEIARQTIDSKKAKFFPKLELIAQAKKKNDDAGTAGNKEEYIAKVQLTYPLYAGGGDSAAHKAAGSQLSAAMNRHDDTRLTIEESIRNSWQNMLTARTNAEFLRNQANISGEFLVLARKERRLGKRSLLDVLNGETSYISALSSAVSAETDYSLAAYKLLHAMGSLDLSLFEAK